MTQGKITARLKAARARIERPENWTKLFLARSKSGLAVSADSSDAVAWCLVGACVAGGDRTIAEEAIGRLYRAANLTSKLGVWNDSHPHAEVLALLDKAIAQAEKEGA